MMYSLILALELLASGPPLGVGRPPDPRSVENRPVPPSEELQPVNQLTNPRTGTTCTMLILRGRPADPQSVIPSVPSAVDPGIRGHVSPCLE